MTTFFVIIVYIIQLYSFSHLLEMISHVACTTWLYSIIVFLLFITCSILSNFTPFLSHLLEMISHNNKRIVPEVLKVAPLRLLIKEKQGLIEISHVLGVSRGGPNGRREATSIHE
ncbi:hypothetical protein ACJX0J_030935 [Zea mays]